jgi:hypothetical protein
MHTIPRGFGSSNDPPVSWWAIYRFFDRVVTFELHCVCGIFPLRPRVDGTVAVDHDCSGFRWKDTLKLDGYPIKNKKAKGSREED